MIEEIQGYEVARLNDPTPAQLVETIDHSERANIDMQVATAHQYPRSISRCVNNSIAIATMDMETAQSCGYALPRGGKPITGPSVHLAKIIAQQYGNMRAEARVVNVTATQVVSRGTAWDLENNYAVAFEVRRSILTSKGGRFSEDMITVTGNAANAIAFRNAIFTLVPKAITDKVYKAAQNLITGDLSDEENSSSVAQVQSSISMICTAYQRKRLSSCVASIPSIRFRQMKLPYCLESFSHSKTVIQPLKR